MLIGIVRYDSIAPCVVDVLFVHPATARRSETHTVGPETHTLARHRRVCAFRSCLHTVSV
jgi:hypothetical protein